MVISNDRPLQPAVEECEGGQTEEETDLDDGLEIVEQSALNHFSAILQKAQSLAAEAEKKNPRKRPKRYTGKSEKTLKRRKKHREDLAKKGYLSVFEFIAHVKESAKKKEHMKQLVASATKCGHVSEESEPEELDTEELDTEDLDTEDLVIKRVGLVRRRNLLMHCN